MKQFLSVHDVSGVGTLVDEVLALKKEPLKHSSLGKGKCLGLLFFNASLRTRLSTQKAAQNLGMNCIVMNVGSDGWQLEFEDGAVMNTDKAEHIKEAAAVISQYCDIIGVRSFPGLENRDEDYGEKIMQSFAYHTTKPIISLESATLHPLQSLTDMATIKEFSSVPKPKVVLTWAPHPRALPQAVANSFAQWALAAEHDLTIVQPEGYALSPEFTHGAKILNDQEKAFEGADFIYVKNWSSYDSYGQVLNSSAEWQVTAQKLEVTNSAKVMHCLPVRKNVVISDNVLDSENSIVIQQAGNREFAAQAVLKRMLADG
jgi:N-succinyl-L-ornithine transcarbamylase